MNIQLENFTWTHTHTHSENLQIKLIWEMIWIDEIEMSICCDLTICLFPQHAADSMLTVSQNVLPPIDLCNHTVTNR